MSPASDFQQECPICFELCPAEIIGVHCERHFTVEASSPPGQASQADEDVTILDEAPRQQPVTHNRRSAGFPQRLPSDALSRSAEPSREAQDFSSPDLSPALLTCFAAQQQGQTQAYIVGEPCQLGLQVCSCLLVIALHSVRCFVFFTYCWQVVYPKASDTVSGLFCRVLQTLPHGKG